MGRTSRDKRDIYYRLAKEEGWRARSAFKLLQIDKRFHIFENVTRVVDLCAAPGSWSQVLSKRLRENNPDSKDVKIVAVDLQDMAEIPDVTYIKGDITKLSTACAIREHFEGDHLVQLVVCDGAPDVIGLHDVDEYIQGQLILAALNITTHVLMSGGNFVAKIFRGKYTSALYGHLQKFFKKISVAKPACSRNSSIEAFVVCQNFHFPKGYIPQMITPMVCSNGVLDSKEKGELEIFVFCEDPNGYDADMSYSLSDNYTYHEVVQKPISPAYKEIIELTRNCSLRNSSITIRHEEQDDEFDYD